MANPGNIVILQDDGQEGRRLYLFTYWRRDELPRLLANALRRGQDRWDDPPYLARIIFSEMIRDDIDGTMGYGISTFHEAGGESLVVDCSDQMVHSADGFFPAVLPSRKSSRATPTKA